MYLNLEQIRAKIQGNYENEKKIEKAKKYYRVDNTIKKTGVRPKEDTKDPLRTANNKIPHNFHQILVDEKASYLFTYPILFDIDNNNKLNTQVSEVLGDDFQRKAKNICIEASNAGTAWVHYWYAEDKEGEKNFKYEKVNTEEVIPLYDNGLEKTLEGLIRYYIVNEYVEGELNPQDFCYIEYWTADRMERWKLRNSYNGSIVEYEDVEHTIGEIPFIEFANNLNKQGDLEKYVTLIDMMDKVMSGFCNDMEDIQQVLYILEGYEGTDLKEFKDNLKRYKTLSFDTEGGGLKTIQIDIPVEARKVIVEILKKQIYESGQGLQADIDSIGNASGITLKFFYRKLELKAGLLETEFRSGFATLVKAILRFLNVENYKKINQTWTRNMISNDLENSQIAQASMGIIPKKIILANHPWVDDVQLALDLLEEEEKENMIDYNFNAIGGSNE